MVENITILSIEDDIILGEMIVEALSSAFSNPILATSWESARTILLSKEVHIILLDLMLPNYDGFDLISKIREETKLQHSSIIILSAIDNAASVVRGLELGADDYIIKPVEISVMLARIKVQLKKMEYKRQHQRLQEENTALKSALATMQPIFISYAHGDKSLAKLVAQDLRGNGFDVWFDENIRQGSSWWHTIASAIENCAAFIVIMTPESEQSEWVHKEILLAKRDKKPIFPLLARGREFSILIDIQFFDMTNGNSLNKDFFALLSTSINNESKT